MIGRVGSKKVDGGAMTYYGEPQRSKAALEAADEPGTGTKWRLPQRSPLAGIGPKGQAQPPYVSGLNKVYNMNNTYQDLDIV